MIEIDYDYGDDEQYGDFDDGRLVLHDIDGERPDRWYRATRPKTDEPEEVD